MKNTGEQTSPNPSEGGEQYRGLQMSLVLKEVYNKANTIHDDTSIIKSRECCYSNKRNIGYPIKNA